MTSIWYLRRLIEAWYPLILSVIGGTIIAIFPGEWLSNDFCQKLASQYLTLLGTFFGFIFASMAMLLGLSENSFIKGTRQSGAFGLLIQYHIKCLLWCGFGFASALVIQFLPDENFNQILGAVFIALGIGMVLSTYRLARLFLFMLRCLKLA